MCISEDFMPFSYFNTIIINRSNIVKENIDGILTHEMAHIRQFHFIDLLIVELFAVVQWFNPIIWLYERSLKEVHEYLADEATIISGYNKPWYQALLVNQAIGAEAFGLTNQFKNSLIKKRLTMISKIRTSKTAQLKGLFVLPAILLLFMVFAKPAESSFISQSKGEIVKGKVVNTNSNKSMANVSVVVSGTTIGTKTDKDGQFTLEIPAGNTELVFSCIGYNTVKQTIIKNEKLIVKMKETDYKISFGTENEFVDEPTEAPKIKMEANTYVMAIEEKMPSFKGGTKAILEYLRTNLKYPDNEKAKGIHGEVLVSFSVNTNGKISDVKVEKGVSENLDKEALRLVKNMPDWSPGRQSGNPVKVKFTMPVKFE
jgi:TonB family protein